MQKLETTITSLTKRGEQLVAMRAAAQDALDEATKARQAALLSGDLNDQRALDNLRGAVDMTTSSVTALDDALAVLAQEKVEAERQLAAEHDRIDRAMAADKLAMQVAAIEAALPNFLEQSSVLADALSAISHWHFEASQIAGFVQNTRGQVEIAANFALAELRTMPDAIRHGRQAMPPLMPSTALVSAAAEPTPEMQTVFMLRSAWFRDAHEQRKFAGQYEDAIMPIGTACRALDQRIAVDVTDPRRAQLRGVRGGDFSPQAADVIDLDTVEEPKNAAPVEPDRVLRDAAFTVIDRSADARTIQIEVPRL
ncbi:hypothetical protein FBZ93_10352 [Bradyrhizobium macuxiense]|uniref:Uncharacterized protein n=1 Tax=Bradyrhizobium macuxiense TaxID=1755647 RepID=A0A560MBP6_9BRAD|nr:hypothetical protein [Bradyrhizobium macuxiense]TWC05042.1 hypothetical protein FBZ93_10352 [Bradyrhizobium macuxiense]